MGEPLYKSRRRSSLSVSRISRRTIVLLSFITATVVANAFAVPVAENYYQFYPSLAHIQLSLTDLQLKNITQYLEVKGSFTVMNPTDYKGFILTIFRGSYELDKDNITVSRGANLPGPPGFVTRPLDKNVPIDVVVPFNATSTAVKNIQVLFIIELVLSTFLDGFGPVIITYACQGTGGPGTCYLATISANGSFPGVGGKGGGV
ncbi:MAG TPA: hypothetical protein VGS11_06665 [Candidatus Bathyarchaeia archaeon]|nr:hypothetical protein [Candidatus Bathyarchaeia archaeon]